MHLAPQRPAWCHRPGRRGLPPPCPQSPEGRGRGPTPSVQVGEVGQVVSSANTARAAGCFGKVEAPDRAETLCPGLWRLWRVWRTAEEQSLAGDPLTHQVASRCGETPGRGRRFLTLARRHVRGRRKTLPAQDTRCSPSTQAPSAPHFDGRTQRLTPSSLAAYVPVMSENSSASPSCNPSVVRRWWSLMISTCAGGYSGSSPWNTIPR